MLLHDALILLEKYQNINIYNLFNEDLNKKLKTDISNAFKLFLLARENAPNILILLLKDINIYTNNKLGSISSILCGVTQKHYGEIEKGDTPIYLLQSCTHKIFIQCASEGINRFICIHDRGYAYAIPYIFVYNDFLDFTENEYYMLRTYNVCDLNIYTTRYNKHYLYKSQYIPKPKNLLVNIISDYKYSDNINIYIFFLIFIFIFVILIHKGGWPIKKI